MNKLEQKYIYWKNIGFFPRRFPQSSSDSTICK